VTLHPDSGATICYYPREIVRATIEVLARR